MKGARARDQGNERRFLRQRRYWGGRVVRRCGCALCKRRKRIDAQWRGAYGGSARVLAAMTDRELD